MNSLDRVVLSYPIRVFQRFLFSACYVLIVQVSICSVMDEPAVSLPRSIVKKKLASNRRWSIRSGLHYPLTSRMNVLLYFCIFYKVHCTACTCCSSSVDL